MQTTSVIVAAAACAGIVLFVGSTAPFKSASYRGVFRDRWQHPARVIQALGIRPGHHVADLGAGGGYFTFRLADAVGSSGRVYAVDIDADMVQYVAERAEVAGHRNIETVLAVPADTHLPEGGVDLVFTCNTYHHLEDRPAYFARLKRILRPGGRVAIIDYNQNSFLPWLVGHISPSDVVRTELAAAGYRVEQEYDFLPKQTFVVFAKD